MISRLDSLMPTWTQYWMSKSAQTESADPRRTSGGAGNSNVYNYL